MRFCCASTGIVFSNNWLGMDECNDRRINEIDYRSDKRLDG